MHSYESLHPDSRVWVYQSDRAFTNTEVEAIDQALARFTTDWVAHNVALKAFGKVFHHRFIVLMVDETGQSATGCSIDKSVKFLQHLEAELSVNVFDRLQLAYERDNSIHTVHRNDLEEAMQQGRVLPDTIVFHNLIQTKSDFEQKWRVPLRDSWAGAMVGV